MTFERAREADVRPIRWFGALGLGFARALGKAEDREIALLKAAVSMLSPDFCPDDALERLARVFRLPTFLNELPERLRGRLQEAFPTWEEAGLPDAIIRSLRGYGVPDVRVFHWAEWQTPDNWFSKFWVYVKGLHGPLKWGEFKWGDASWGTTAEKFEQRSMIGQVVFWKSPQSLPVAIIVDIGEGMIWGVHRWGELPWGGESISWHLTNLWGAENTRWGAFKWGNGRWITGEI